MIEWDVVHLFLFSFSFVAFVQRGVSELWV